MMVVVCAADDARVGTGAEEGGREGERESGRMIIE
jgi:hypothetical protein